MTCTAALRLSAAGLRGSRRAGLLLRREAFGAATRPSCSGFAAPGAAVRAGGRREERRAASSLSSSAGGRGAAQGTTGAPAPAPRSCPPKVGDVIRLTCDSLATGGEGVCRLDGGLVCFVHRGWPGEVFWARVTKVPTLHASLTSLHGRPLQSESSLRLNPFPSVATPRDPSCRACTPVNLDPHPCRLSDPYICAPYISSSGDVSPRQQRSPWRELVTKAPMSLQCNAAAKVSKRFVSAVKTETIEGHLNAVTPLCKHFGPCGGCTLQSIEYDEQLKSKRRHVVDAVRRIGGLEDAEGLVETSVGSREQYG